MPPVLPTAGVPQGAHFVREWGAPRSSYGGGTPGSVVSPGVGRFTSLCPLDFPTAGVPHRREARSGAPPLLRRLRRRVSPRAGSSDTNPGCPIKRQSDGGAFRTRGKGNFHRRIHRQSTKDVENADTVRPSFSSPSPRGDPRWAYRHSRSNIPFPQRFFPSPENGVRSVH